ncbi:DUF3267 domain-containing protein [Microbacterium sp. zg-YB36]|uniref:DUF3267 domain-containing protein n=1 Tax=Microbacterium sp. zg-YB36 TaxID=2969407 RepID=UPI00214C7CB5|nr:DUF3267 domain-containing protein [Microbacterium sp. zg-YB36]MDL5350146.1 DUF3267 domain-containing protein [Microbacterium sp. zg-YB36]
MSANRSTQNAAHLPAGFQADHTVSLRQKRYAFAVQTIFILASLLSVGAALLFRLPLETAWPPAITILVTLLALLVYMALHELSHGVALQLMTGVRPTYALRFPFLTTGTDAYLNRRTAVIAALTPVIVWGLVLFAALTTVPQDCRLTVYILLTLNFAGSAGDFVEVYVASRQPAGALIQDDGDIVHVFVPTPRT